MIDEIAPVLIEALGNIVGARILELNCGEGVFTRQLALRGAWVTAIDPSEMAVATALKREIEKPLGIEYQTADPQSAASLWGRDSFDIVVSATFGEVTRPEAVLRSVGRTLVSGGRLVIVVPLAPRGRFNAEQWVEIIERSGFGVRRASERWVVVPDDSNPAPDRAADYLLVDAVLTGRQER